MIATLSFEGGHVFNRGSYPPSVLLQYTPLLKQIRSTVDLKYANVDVAQAEQVLPSEGYSIRHTSCTDTANNINPGPFTDRIAAILKDCFQEDIRIKAGRDSLFTLIDYTVRDQVAITEGNFFASSSRSEGTYYAYSSSFYSMRKASFCFLVLSLLSFRDQSSVFGTATNFGSGVAYKAQIFECKKVFNGTLYNHGRLNRGESLYSSDGRHKATLSHDGDFTVDDRWEAGTTISGAGRAQYLIMQEDANLVLYDGNYRPSWASNTAKDMTAIREGRCPGSPWRLEMQGDGNLVVYDANESPLWAIGI